MNKGIKHTIIVMEILRSTTNNNNNKNPIFNYTYAKNNDKVSDATKLEYIKRLHIPPAWSNVQISTNPKSKIQAYGYDVANRKQVIYAKWFSEKNKVNKYKHILRIEPIIQTIRNDIRNTLQQYIDSKESKEHSVPVTVQLALILHIMMLCNFRIGNTADTHGKVKAYGLTTLEWNHISFENSTRTVNFEFVGKKGVINKASCNDNYVYNILRIMVKMHSKNKNGEPFVFTVSSNQVNAFLSIYDPDITSKDIRTWMANEIYIKYFMENPEGERKFEKRKKNALTHVASHLHNTPAVCKTSYIFPQFLDV